MKIRYIHWMNITLLFLSFSLISCSSGNNETNSEESLSLQSAECAKQLIEIIHNDTARIMPVARMLDSTPDSVAYIMKNQLLPDKSLSQRINLLYTDYIDNGESFKRLRNDRDPEYHWHEYVLDYPWLHPWGFWLSIVFMIIFIIIDCLGDGFDDYLINLGTIIIAAGASGLIYLVAWIFSLCASPDIYNIDELPDKPQIQLKESKHIKEKSNPAKQRINYTEKASAMKFIEEKRIYLIDLTRSMEGFNGSEDIFDTVKRQLKNAIMSLTDTTTQVVLIPFTDRPLDFVDKTIANKVELLDYIENLETKRGDTNILSAWQKGVEQLDPNKVNYLFMLTDGVHNTGEPIENLYNELETWHDITQGKYQFAFYVLLSQHAREEEICDIVENSKQMWLVPSLNIDTDFILGKLNLSVNIINTNKVKLHLTCTNPEIFNDGFNIKLSIPENEYYKIVNASRVLDADGFITFEIEKLKPQNELPVSYSTVLKVNYDKNKFPLVFFTPEEYNLTIDNIGTRTMNLTSKSK